MEQIINNAKVFWKTTVVPVLEYLYIHFYICMSLVLDNLGQHTILNKYLKFKEKTVDMDILETKYTESNISFCNNIKDIQLGENVLIVPGLIRNSQLETLAKNNIKCNFVIQSESELSFESENIDVEKELTDKKFDVIIVGPHLINNSIEDAVKTYNDYLTEDGSLYYETLLYYPNDNTIKQPLVLKDTFTFGSITNDTLIPSFIEVASNPFKIVDINEIGRFINKDYYNFANSFFDDHKDIYGLLMRINMYAKHYKYPLMFVRMKIN